MDDDVRPGRVPELLTAGRAREATEAFETLREGSVEERKEALRAFEDLATAETAALEPVVDQLVACLADEDRAVRLITAKLLVTVARNGPTTLLPVAETVAERLADETEFYLVRARTAEALGYLAREDPERVATPSVLADLRVGLAFDEPAVREKLAKALELVALADPSLLDHQVDSLADHLDDEESLVRYHLATTCAVVGCRRPAALAVAADRLAGRLDDENHFVRGRAAEALGLLARANETETPLPADALADLVEDEPFVADRARYALAGVDHPAGAADVDGVGTIAAIRDGTEDVLDELTAPAADGTCAHCGLAVPAPGPPTCPRCGGPL